MATSIGEKVQKWSDELEAVINKNTMSKPIFISPKDTAINAPHLGIQTVGEALEIIGAWNGEDETFYHNGAMYHEYDVALLSDLIQD